MLFNSFSKLVMVNLLNLKRTVKYRLSDYIFTTRKAAQDQVINYIGYFNGSRLHSTLGYQPPVIYEKELYCNAA
jgi:hypothetical protein